MSITTNIMHSLHQFAEKDPLHPCFQDLEATADQTCKVGERICDEKGQFWLYTNCLAQWGPLSYPQWKALEMFYQELEDRDHEYAFQGSKFDFELDQLGPNNQQIRDLLARCCQDQRVGWSEAKDLACRVFHLPSEEIRP